MESTALNVFRVEASRWHTAGSNHEGRLYAIKQFTLELASQEVGGVDPATIYPTTPLPEGLGDCSGKSLSDLRVEIQEMERKLVHYWSAASLYASSYFEKLLQLSSAEVEDSPDEMSPPTREVKTEALLDTLIWATHRFGGVSKALSQISEAATKICDTASGLCPSMADQTNSVVKLSEGLLALTAHVKVNGDNGGPILAVLKQISKNIEKSYLAGNWPRQDQQHVDQRPVAQPRQGGWGNPSADWQGSRSHKEHVRGRSSSQRKSKRRKSAAQRIDRRTTHGPSTSNAEYCAAADFGATALSGTIGGYGKPGGQYDPGSLSASTPGSGEDPWNPSSTTASAARSKPGNGACHSNR